MKLYNLYECVILEEINNQKLLLEGVSNQEIDDAINGKYNVKILYQDIKGKSPTDRYVQIYNRGVTHAGNPAIRVFQIGGQTNSQVGEWKLLRIDRILNMTKSGMKWYNPVSDYDTSIPSYNQTGDKSMSIVNKKVDPTTFTRQRSDISQKPRPPLQITNNDNNNQ